MKDYVPGIMPETWLLASCMQSRCWIALLSCVHVITLVPAPWYSETPNFKPAYDSNCFNLHMLPQRIRGHEPKLHQQY